MLQFLSQEGPSAVELFFEILNLIFQISTADSNTKDFYFGNKDLKSSIIHCAEFELLSKNYINKKYLFESDQNIKILSEKIKINSCCQRYSSVIST